ncbi:MAG TPA: hypothetical protein VMU16_03850, partial [Candidatus Binataceae bacterium]|nr:hypothetical protein [Candidatus Binataceae bacterium]
MTRKLKLVKGAAHRGALVYGMRLFDRGGVVTIDPARVEMADGAAGSVTMHVIEGTRAQIRRQLMHSI